MKKMCKRHKKTQKISLSKVLEDIYLDSERNTFDMHRVFKYLLLQKTKNLKHTKHCMEQKPKLRFI